ncbi:MAG TPA: c-type cytochrome [Ferruginibacter sp.]|nr:c-type cytochrome [Ferruginibacter sp.]HMP22080.1 c-type cytochrome [Ferruginibacter sp.]
MRLAKKNTTTILVLFLIAVVASSNMIVPRTKFKNLKVLPADISEKQLDSIMDTYNRALKVSCDFCHNKQPVTNSLLLAPADTPLDFAADNGMKEEARRMMRLTIDLNQQYFNHDSSVKKMGYLLNVVTCNTCHRGNPYPVYE